METTTTNSFKQGWLQARAIDQPEIRKKISVMLNIDNDPQWYRRLYGQVQLSNAERIVVENIFNSYGIIDIWD